MQLLSLHIDQEDSAKVSSGWSFRKKTLTVANSQGMAFFSKIFIPFHVHYDQQTINDGYLNPTGAIVPDKSHHDNHGSYLIFISSETGMIHIPKEVNINQIMIEPVPNKRGTMFACVLCLLKAQPVDIRIGSSKRIRLVYDQLGQTVLVTDVTDPLYYFKKNLTVHKPWWSRALKKPWTIATRFAKNIKKIFFKEPEWFGYP